MEILKRGMYEFKKLSVSQKFVFTLICVFLTTSLHLLFVLPGLEKMVVDFDIGEINYQPDPGKGYEINFMWEWEEKQRQAKIAAEYRARGEAAFQKHVEREAKEKAAFEERKRKHYELEERIKKGPDPMVYVFGAIMAVSAVLYLIFGPPPS